MNKILNLLEKSHMLEGVLKFSKWNVIFNNYEICIKILCFESDIEIRQYSFIILFDQKKSLKFHSNIEMLISLLSIQILRNFDKSHVFDLKI